MDYQLRGKSAYVSAGAHGIGESIADQLVEHYGTDRDTAVRRFLEDRQMPMGAGHAAVQAPADRFMKRQAAPALYSCSFPMSLPSGTRLGPGPTRSTGDWRAIPDRSMDRASEGPRLTARGGDLQIRSPPSARLTPLLDRDNHHVGGLPASVLGFVRHTAADEHRLAARPRRLRRFAVDRKRQWGRAERDDDLVELMLASGWFDERCGRRPAVGRGARAFGQDLQFQAGAGRRERRLARRGALEFDEQPS